MAVSSPDAASAVGIDPLSRRTMREDVERLATIARQRNVGLFLVGLPLLMNGDEGEMAAFVRAFAERLAVGTGIPIQYQDERFTSVEAESRLAERGMSLKRMLKQKRRGAVDQLAAVIMLEEHLRRRQERE
jgi:putative holliday junction resolvase